MDPERKRRRGRTANSEASWASEDRAESMMAHSLQDASKREHQPYRGYRLLTGTCLLTESDSVFKCILLLSVKDFTQGETNSIGKV